MQVFQNRSLAKYCDKAFTLPYIETLPGRRIYELTLYVHIYKNTDTVTRILLERIKHML